MQLDYLKKEDPEVFDGIVKELKRQREGAEMIPSENIVSLAVLQAMGTVGTNKYSEGLPKKRYYGGNEFIDEIELLAIDRAKKLFKAEHANVQPYSGSPANMAAYFTLMNPGDTLLGMKLDQGGHLTHGHPVNFSGKLYKVVSYGVRKDNELIDFDEVRRLAKENNPKVIQAGFTAYPREIDFKQFKEIADEVGAHLFVDMSHFAGLVAGNVHQSPVPFADVVMTTTHKTLRGPRGAILLCKQEFAEKLDKNVFPGLQGGPHNHINAAKAVSFKEAMTPEFQEYAEQIVRNTKALEKVFENQLRMVSGGSDTHLLLLDLSQKNVTGKEAETALDKAAIYVNKNAIPFDLRKPWDPSGIRLGTPSLTTRGMKEKEMKIIGEQIINAVNNSKDENALLEIRKTITDLCLQFPIYPELNF
ncbi:MAG: serine hydroxymethyltransferase [archaeon]|nr:serine hydroxymethyltransferase [archaeon]